jgi:cytoskeletal protein RodZ
MDTPGTVLKAERERQQKSLKEVARVLKLKIEYLQAIEDDEYSLLPAEVFARSYIRLYSDVLDLDSTYLLDLYENLGKEAVIEEPVSAEPLVERPEHREQDIPSAQPERSARMRRLALPLILIAALVVVALFTATQKKDTIPEEKTHKAEKKEILESETPATEQKMTTDSAGSVNAESGISDQAPVARKEKPPAETHKERKTVVATAPPAPSVTEIKKPAAREPVTTPAVMPSQTITQPAPAQDPAVEMKTREVDKKILRGDMVLKIIAKELTWVSMRVDGADPIERKLRAGQEFTVKGREKFVIKIGNAGGTQVLLNNTDIGSLGPPGKIVNIVLPR